MSSQLLFLPSAQQCLLLPCLSRYTSVDDFDYKIWKKYKAAPRPRGNQGGKNKQKFLNCVCAFDIETTGIREIRNSVMYIWQFQIDEEITVFGRTWDQFSEFLIRTKKMLPKNCRLLIYVHNLSYEFSFLKGIYKFGIDDVFAVQRRKVLKCTMYQIFEFRCSYLQSNMNLQDFTRKMNVKHKKLTDFDYGLQRYPWSRLTVEELLYCQNDVLGLVEAIKAEMLRDNDTVYTIPFTSTGYVRREMKHASKKLDHMFFQTMFPDKRQYYALKEAFRGGDTHGNRYYSDVELPGVHSYDRSSSYPDVLINCKYPMRPFDEVLIVPSLETIETGIFDRERCYLMRVRLTDVRLRIRDWGCPYLAKAKCRKIRGGSFFNGRILSAEYLETTITDVDYRIIKEEYTFNIEVFQLWKSVYGYLPKAFRDIIIEYYRRKTQLKNVKGQEIYYDKSKNLLNSCYGMMATDPIRIAIDYLAEDGDFHYDFEDIVSETHPDREQKNLDELFRIARKKSFICYQWGCWCTAWARLRLHEGIRIVSDPAAGRDFVYADTDSVKYLGDADWTEYNKQRMEDSLRSGAYADDPAGIRHYMGVFEQEKDYDLFKHCGAKKYAGIIGGKLKVTIAGVNKKKGSEELAAAGGLSALQDGFVFRDAGGTAAVYNDLLNSYDYTLPDGNVLTISSNVYLEESEYTVGKTQEYKDILTMCKQDIDYIAKIWYYEQAGTEPAK